MDSYNPNLSEFFLSDYKNKLRNSYKQRFQGNCLFSTFYKINERSMFDEYVESYYEIIGENSPIRFTAILDFPLYNIQQINPGMEWVEGEGLKSSSDIILECIVPPLSIVPTVGDFIHLDSISWSGTFMVQDQISYSDIDTPNYSKLNLKLTRYNINEVEKQVTSIYNYVYTRDRILEGNDYVSVVNSIEKLTNLINTVKNNPFYYSKIERLFNYNSSSNSILESTMVFNEIRNSHLVSINANKPLIKNLYRYSHWNEIFQGNFESIQNITISDYYYSLGISNPELFLAINENILNKTSYTIKLDSIISTMKNLYSYSLLDLTAIELLEESSETGLDLTVFKDTLNTLASSLLIDTTTAFNAINNYDLITNDSFQITKAYLETLSPADKELSNIVLPLVFFDKRLKDQLAKYDIDIFIFLKNTTLDTMENTLANNDGSLEYGSLVELLAGLVGLYKIFNRLIEFSVIYNRLKNEYEATTYLT
jgi:hypothetical protein